MADLGNASEMIYQDMIYRVSDEQWDTLLLAVPKLNVRERRAFEAVLYVLRTATPWADLPEDLNVSGRTAWNKHQFWSKEGLWEFMLELFLVTLEPPVRHRLERDMARAELASSRSHGRQKRSRVLESLSSDSVSIPVDALI